MTDVDPTPPDGYLARRLTPDDAQAVADIVAATELDVDGAVEIDVTDVRGDWDRPSFDLATMSVGVERDGRLVAFAETFAGRGEVEVHPSDRDHGLGSDLMRWTWRVARAQGHDEVGQIVSDRHATAIALFRANGYEAGRSSWILRIDLGDLPTPVLPEGFSIRDLEEGVDDHAAFDVISTAFAEWRGRLDAFEDWRASVLRHPAVLPSVTPVVVHDGRIVGVAIGMDYGEAADEGWVQQLAVERAFRGRGLGRALLVESFRRFRALGYGRAGLSTDSRTGALGLYEHVGMRVDRSYTYWAKRLTND